MTRSGIEKKARFTSLRFKIMLGVSLCLVIGFTFITAVLFQQQSRVLTKSVNESFLINSSSLLSQLSPAVKFKQTSAIVDLFKIRALDLGRNDKLASVVVMLADGSALSSFQSSELASFNLDELLVDFDGKIDEVEIQYLEKHTVVHSPLLFGPRNTNVGSVMLAWDLAPLQSSLLEALVSAVLISLGSILVVLVVIYTILGRLLTKPMSVLSKAMLSLAGNQEDVRIPFLEKKDELGVMAGTVEIFRKNLIETNRLRDQQDKSVLEQKIREKEEGQKERKLHEKEIRRHEAEMKLSAEQNEHAKLLQMRVDRLLVSVNEAAKGNLLYPMDQEGDDLPGQMARALNSFFTELRASIAEIENSARQMSNDSDKLTDLSLNMSQAATSNASNVENALLLSTNMKESVGSIVNATSDLSVSIKHIADNSIEAKSVAAEAVDLAVKTDSSVRKLSGSSASIGHVIKVITSIAEQTNLLALNATIEAARAGDAGKGFAVVANEVKELAKETAKATVQIESRINEIQADTDSAVTAIASIGKIISRISAIQSTIAVSIDQQSDVTKNINQSVLDASNGSDAIVSLIQEVAERAIVNKNSSSDVSSAAKEIGNIALLLQDLVSTYSQDKVYGRAA